MEQSKEQGKLPENAELLMAIQHTGKAPQKLPESPLWKFAGTYSGIARYQLTKEGYKQFARLQEDFPQVVQEHLICAQKNLDAEIAAQKLKVENEYLFDLTLTTSVRIKAASRAEAEATIRDVVDGASCNMGAWPNGDPILCNFSIEGELDLDEVVRGGTASSPK